MAQSQRQFINALVREAQRFDEIYLLAEKELRTASNGKMFIRGALQDRTGQARMIIWEVTEKFYEALPRGGFVRVKGRVEVYQNRPQLVIEACLPINDRDVELADFLPATPKDVVAMEKELRETLGSIADPTIKALTNAFLNDAELMRSFCRSPAATVNHHAYLGGLLEHSLGLMRMATRITPLYSVLNRDIMLLGCFLHDIGKTVELSSDREFSYTDAGRLVGHLVQGVLILQGKVQAARQAGTEIPDILVRQLEHLILAHHGEYEFGSPKLPMTAEAVAVHFLDNLDAKLAAFSQAVTDHPVAEESWTARQFMFDNQMLFRGTEEDRRRRRTSLAEPANADTPDKGPPLKGGLE
jgi:3'-5' exoribonuclease